MGAVRRVTDIMGEISAASSEQSSGIEQVSNTVVQMDQTTQQNAAQVEEAAAAAKGLEQQAFALVQLVSLFRIGQGGASAIEDTHSLPDKSRHQITIWSPFGGCSDLAVSQSGRQVAIRWLSQSGSVPQIATNRGPKPGPEHGSMRTP